MSLTASPFSRSFVKEEHSLCLNYACDYVPSGPLTRTNAKHGNLEKRRSRRQDGGYRQLQHLHQLGRQHSPSCMSALTPQPQELSANVSPQAHSHWGKVHPRFTSIICSPSPTAPCPSSYGCYNCPQGLKCGSHCECQETQTQVLLKDLNREISHFFLCVAVHAHKHLGRAQTRPNFIYSLGIVPQSTALFIRRRGGEARKKVLMR